MPYADSDYERNWQRQAKGWVLHPVKHEWHTPGPWDYDDDSKEVFSSCKEHRCGWIAYLDGNDSNDCSLPEGMRIANARLIAAAPELLATLKRLREVFEQLSDGDWRHMDATYVDQLIESDGLLGCDKVIAKAEGRSE